MEDMKIEFKIRQPSNVIESELNTLILVTDYIYSMYEKPMASEDRRYYCQQLELVKATCDNIRTLINY